ncbi:MAG TPA: sigma-70 family RNA polymerase sigma factor [Thermoanaerobaculia bacterium]|jgi:RNA polymerase sigma-70 factor (ECF subfamily)
MRSEPQPTVQTGDAAGPEEVSVRRLIESCQAGDRAALELFFERYRDEVFTMAVSLCGDEVLAGDIAQDVFLKVMTRIRQFRFDAGVTTWLYRIVLNTFLDHRRSRRHENLAFEELMVAHAATQHADVERRETARLVRAAITTLRPKLRMPLVLRYVSGLSYEESAAVLGIAVGTVASRLSRAHAALADKLRPLVERER